MNKRQQQRKKRIKQWQPHLEAWKESGKTMKAYCRIHDLSYDQFKYWQYTLFPKQPKAKQNTISPSTIDPTIQPEYKLGFVPLTVTPTEPVLSEAVMDWAGIELLIGNLKLRLYPGYDPSILKQLVEQLGDLSC